MHRYRYKYKYIYIYAFISKFIYVHILYIYMYLHEKTHVCMYILIYRHIKFLCFVPARNPSTPVLSGQILGEVELLETQLA